MNKDLLIKVCGMADVDSISQFPSLGADFMGMIFYPKSKRYVESEAFEGNFAAIENFPIDKFNLVGVFVDEDIDIIFEQAEKYQFDYIQLHGDEDPSIANILSYEGFKIIKAFGISCEEDLQNISSEWDDVADYLLFDYKTSQKGGSGCKFDWSLLSAYKGETPFLLSGGISEEDADSILAINHDKFAGIDLNSKFEIEPGKKDIEALSRFINKIRE